MDDEKKTMHLNIQAFSHRNYAKAYRKIFKQLHKNKIENLVIDLRYNGGGSLSNSQLLLKYLLNEPVKQTSYTTIKKYPLRKYTKGNIVFRITRAFFRVYGTTRKSGDTSFYTVKIKPKKKWHYDKNIYVLTNGGSFSASCLVGAYLKETHRAVFIGRETGGTIEGCNAVITPYYKLPNTKTKVRVPTFRLLHDVYTEGNTGRGIIPDYETNYTFKDIFLKKDLEMEKVMELIRKK
jgi:C-terminal processing protease CtpA/Prc